MKTGNYGASCITGLPPGISGSYNILTHETKRKELTKAGGRFPPTYPHTYNQVNEPQVNFFSIPMNRSSESLEVIVIYLYLKVCFRRIKN